MLFALLAGTWPNYRAVAAETNAPAAKPAPPVVTFESFRIIAQRNVFNQDRRPRIERTAQSEAPRRQPRVEAFGLVGTMSYEKGAFAVFDGTSSAFKKVVQAGEKVAGYTVASVGNDHVKLKSADKEIQLPMHSQLRREDEGEWKMTVMTDGFTAAITPPSGAANIDFPRTRTRGDPTTRDNSSGGINSRNSSQQDFSGGRGGGGGGRGAGRRTRGGN